MKNIIQKSVAVIQLVGSIYGLVLLAYLYLPMLIEGNSNVLNSTIVVLLLSLFGVCLWAAIKVLRKNNSSLLQLMLLLQIASFSVKGFGYEFYSGITIPLGLSGSELGINLIVGSNAALAINNAGPQFNFTVNLAAIIFLLLIKRR